MVKVRGIISLEFLVEERYMNCLKAFKKTVYVMDNDILKDILKHYDETLSSSAQFKIEDLNHVRKKKKIVMEELQRRY